MPEPIQPFAVLGHLRRGSGDPTMKLWARGCIRATRTPDGPATVHLRFDGSAATTATAWGQGAAWAIEHAPDLLGAADDGAPEFRPADPYVRRLWHEAGGAGAVRIGRSHAVCEALVPTILEQRVTGGGARRSYRWLVRRFGEPAPGSFGLTLPPCPDVLAAQPSWVFHRAGVERSRAETIKRALQRAVRIEEAVTMSMADAHARLRAFAGIGVWTANEVALVALGDADAVSVGDYHLKNIVGYALTGQRNTDDARMLELLEPWRGQRQRVVRLLLAGGPRRPRRGPRFAPTNYRGR